MGLTGWDWVWGAWFAAFVILELLAVSGAVPWQTLSTTAWGVEKLSSWVRLLVAVGLFVLLLHIVWGFPDQ